MVKASAVAVAPSAILLFLGGPAWPFHVATVIAVAAATEESVIVFLLDKPRSNVKTVVHVLRDRESGEVA
jgi:CDP-diacylglycerol--glycerol-3-phosphate 3-phosphatidyltransferase